MADAKEMACANAHRKINAYPPPIGPTGRGQVKKNLKVRGQRADHDAAGVFTGGRNQLPMAVS